MIKFKLLGVYCLFSCSICISQPPYFEKVFGDSTDYCSAVSITQLAVSGNLLVATNNLSISASTNTIKLFKFDVYGNELMRVDFPIIDYQTVNKMKPTPDGNLLFAGVVTYPNGITDGLLFKTDTLGNLIWRTTYGRTLTDESLQGIDFTAQGEIVSSGYTINLGGTGHSFYLIKTDTAGNMVWDMDYSSANNSLSDAVIALSHGDLLISGDRHLANNNYTATIIHTDSIGNQTWDLEIPNLYNNGCKNDLLTKNGDVMIVGESATASSFSFDPAITRIDTTGNIKWSFIYNGSAISTDALFDIIEPVAENFLTTGYALNPSTNSADVILMRIDSLGNELGRIYFGDSIGVDIGYSMVNSLTGSGCYIAGTTVRNSINRGYLVCTGLQGIQTGIVENNHEQIDFNLFPNPCKEVLNFSASIAVNFEISITDFSGKSINRHLLSANKLNTSALSAGMYFAEFKSGNKIIHKNFVVMH